MMIPKSVIMFFGLSEEVVRSRGALGCVFEYEDESHDISWDKTQILVSSSNDVAHYFFVTNRLQSSQSPGSCRVRVCLQDFKSYLYKYDEVRGFLSSFERNRRSRLGPNSTKKPWDISPREAFVIQMPDEAFNEHFIRDPRERVAYAAVLQHRTLLLPIMVKEPQGFPRGGTQDGSTCVPRTGFPARGP